ncbi:MAG: M20 family metallopeptidase [Terriglobia bacterium]
MPRRCSLLLLIVLASAVPAIADQKAGSRQFPATSPAADFQDQIAKAAEALRSQLIDWRRDFHMHPELSNREERTSRVIAERLKAFGFDEVKTGVAKHGIVALLKGSKPGPVVAVRTDLDALPIQETLDVPYKSQNPGVKHACGHDAHMAVELGVAKILSGMRGQIPGTIKFIFQPAEEGAPAGEEGGAELMIKEGALENPKPLAIFGLHTMPALEVGQIGYMSGGAMASADRFFVTVHGQKTHGAMPHMGTDAVVVAAHCILALQSIPSRRTNALDPVVISVGAIHGGNRYNIIADEVKLEGTLRALDEGVRSRVQQMMRETLAGVTSAYGTTFELRFDEGAAVTYNDPKLVEETLPTMRRVVGDDHVILLRPVMVSEDFSYYGKVVPAFFYFLAVGNKAKGISANWHTPEFDIDEDSLVVGVKVMANVLVDYLERHPGSR